MLSRTAKSCGPDAPTLASSLAEVLSALPGSEKTLIRRRRWQKSPVTGESTTYAVKTIAQGMPGVPGYLWLLPLCFLHCTGGFCGCSGHPAFPTPSRGRELPAQPGRIASRGRECLSEIRTPSLRAKRSNPSCRAESMDCCAPLAMTVQNPLLAGCLKIESGANERLTTGIVAVCACASQTRLA